ncbi:PIN domain nuclease [Nocardia lasii]|uniref:Ribonuclease VapC n=1 Tax=Nocardia lasii TaxID=1616107 RepID=A0ABW1JLL2_9NOCA
MTVRYLLDKSAAYRSHLLMVRARIEPLMERGLLATCGVADLEVGVSARSQADHAELGQLRRDALEYLSTPDEVWDRAWQVQELLCADSLHRSVKIPDLIIAAVAEHHRVSILHYDHDFDRIAEITGQPVEWVVPPGSADRLDQG